jgi:hypothetical protein
LESMPRRRVGETLVRIADAVTFHPALGPSLLTSVPYGRQRVPAIA